MRIPEALQQAIRIVAGTVPPAEIAAAAAQLSRAYRDSRSAPYLPSPAHRIAYLQFRLPATFAALSRALALSTACLPGLKPRSLLDIGAGPGTAAWAAAEIFDSLERITHLEHDLRFAKLGGELASTAPHQAVRQAHWIIGDVSQLNLPESDLVVASYVLSELSPTARMAALQRAWQAARVLVIVEPGTPRGFEHVLEARERFIALGAQIAAPCPHHRRCPLAAAGDWCHFAQRVERTAEHRRVKEGELGYEDEKFSYLVVSREPVARPAARIVRHPRRHGGHTQLVLCTASGLQKQTVTRSNKQLYRMARKLEWGDPWEASMK